MGDIQHFMLADDTTVETSVSLDASGRVSSISKSYFDANSGHHLEVTNYNRSPFDLDYVPPVSHLVPELFFLLPFCSLAMVWLGATLIT